MTEDGTSPYLQVLALSGDDAAQSQFRERAIWALTMTRGTVKWFNETKGWGLIVSEDGKEVLVHHTGIAGAGYRTLDEGDEVEYRVTEGPKGPQARTVRKLTPSERTP